MAYGHDYKEALQGFIVFAGKVPLPPFSVIGGQDIGIIWMMNSVIW